MSIVGEGMTYTEISEHVYSSGDGVADRVRALSPTDQLAWNVLKMFDGRGGFDNWWGGIDGETQDEIFDELRKVVGGKL